MGQILKHVAYGIFSNMQWKYIEAWCKGNSTTTVSSNSLFVFIDLGMIENHSTYISQYLVLNVFITNGMPQQSIYIGKIL